MLHEVPGCEIRSLPITRGQHAGEAHLALGASAGRRAGDFGEAFRISERFWEDLDER